MNEYVQSEALPQICVFGLNQMMQWKKTNDGPNI